MKKISQCMFLLFLCIAYTTALAATQTEQLINVNLYGWLDQYSLDDKGIHYIGNEACVPTSSTNAMTYLQNAVPNVFGTTLTGTTYDNWEDTDVNLIHIMGTEPGTGTQWYEFVPGLKYYIGVEKNYPEVQFSGMFPADAWYPSGGYPEPDYMTTGKPTPEFIGNSLAAGSAVLLSIQYVHSEGGHEILANGLTWDPTTNTGTLYFVDPLDPSQNYSPTQPHVLGPVKQTSGTLVLNGDHLVLSYIQYEGRLPYDPTNYELVSANIYGVLSVGGAALTPFSQLLPYGNSHAIAEGFDQLDPTTNAIFSTLAALNTMSQETLEKTFQQMDPSLYNVVLLSEENAAQKIQTVLFDHLMSYRRPCSCSCSCVECGPRIWLAGFDVASCQHSSDHYLSKKGYKDRINGGVLGLECCCEEILVGVGASYTKDHINWKGVKAHGDIEGVGGVVYGAWMCAPFWLDVNFAYSNNSIKGSRHIFGASELYFVQPIDTRITHKNNSNVYSAHLGLSYDLFAGSWCQADYLIWPFLNLDFYNAFQHSFTEKGGGILNYKVLSKNMKLFRPEIGLGASLVRNFCECTAFLNSTLSYANETRFQGKNTRAYFTQNPCSLFEVSGLNPQNNLVCPSLQLGLNSPCDTFRAFISYYGEFGKHFTSNEISAEISVGF